MLTKKQKRVLDFTTGYNERKGFAPSLKEIRKHFKLKSESTIHQHLKILEEKGYLQKRKNQPRGIELKKLDELIEVPVLGYIAAGQPLEAIEVPDGIVTIPKKEVGRGGEFYALRVDGDSMIDEGIFDGDTVVIKKQETADDGQTVVAIVDNNEATLKKIYREKNRVRLQPANPTLFPMYSQEIEIRGIVVKVIRNFDVSTDETKNENEKKIKNEKLFKNTSLILNKIYNADCLEFMRGIKDNAVDLIFADPPYNLSKSNFKMKFIKSGGSDLNTNKGSWDNFTKEEYKSFTKKWLSESFRILKGTGSIWVAGSYHNIYLTGYLMEEIGFEILNEILWHKTDATPNLSCTRFVADHENFLWARRSRKNTFNYEKIKAMNGGKQMRSIWPKGKTNGGKKIHPTQKPEWLLERIILATSNTNDVVFDPFLGSGTTAVVAKKFDRHFIGTEIDKNYFQLAKERIKNTRKLL